MKATEMPTVHPRLFIMGEYGKGKTHLLGMLHELYKMAGTKGMYLYDFDGGYPVLTTNNFDVEFDLYVDKEQNIPTAFNNFSKHTAMFEKDGCGYGIVAIDSLTTFQQAAMNEVIRQNPLSGKDGKEGRRSFNFAGRTVKLTQINDFGVLVGLLNQFFPQLINLSVHMAIALTTHIRLYENELDSSVQRLPAVAGKSLPSQIGLWFNEVILCVDTGFGDSRRHEIQTSGDSKTSLKSQVKGMPFLCPVEEYLYRLAKAYRILKDEQLKELAAKYKLDAKKVASIS